MQNRQLAIGNRWTTDSNWIIVLRSQWIVSLHADSKRLSSVLEALPPETRSVDSKIELGIMFAHTLTRGGFA